MTFEPKIVAFLCTWCSYTGADTAGISRLKSPANIRAIRVPCSGRVSPEIVMRTFDQGADGVIVLGCHIGECHYTNGNHRTAKRMPVLKSLMEFVGLEPERFRLDWVSASEGERYSRIVTEFSECVRSRTGTLEGTGRQVVPAKSTFASTHLCKRNQYQGW
jgi:F420-non-reducing hydrogenase iron-sulfur subunit